MLSDVNPFRELAKVVRRPHFGRYAILLVHLLLLPVLAVVTEGHPKAELAAMVAEQVVFLGAVAALGGRRMFAIGAPLVVPGIVVLAVTFAVGEIPGDHYWFWNHYGWASRPGPVQAERPPTSAFGSNYRPTVRSAARQSLAQLGRTTTSERSGSSGRSSGGSWGRSSGGSFGG